MFYGYEMLLFPVNIIDKNEQLIEFKVEQRTTIYVGKC